MGLDAVDAWTLGHFIFGIIATIAICPEHPGIGILTGNIGHAYMEAMEKNYRKGVLVEADRNHYGDLVAFLMGSLVGIYFTPFTIKYPIVRWILVAILIIVVIQEWGREKWPEKWPFDPAENPFHWFGTVKALVNNNKK